MHSQYSTPDPVAREREAFRRYVDAIGEKVGHGATLDEARKACPDAFRAWREAFTAAYGRDRRWRRAGVMASGSITTRTTPRGERRFVVPYRLSGRSYALVHGGSFRTLREPSSLSRYVATLRLVLDFAGVDPNPAPTSG